MRLFCIHVTICKHNNSTQGSTVCWLSTAVTRLSGKTNQQAAAINAVKLPKTKPGCMQAPHETFAYFRTGFDSLVKDIKRYLHCVMTGLQNISFRKCSQYSKSQLTLNSHTVNSEQNYLHQFLFMQCLWCQTCCNNFVGAISIYINFTDASLLTMWFKTTPLVSYKVCKMCVRFRDMPPVCEHPCFPEQMHWKRIQIRDGEVGLCNS